jgi:hypothetical protein
MKYVIDWKLVSLIDWQLLKLCASALMACWAVRLLRR